MSAPKLPAHGTARRYRLELKTGKACEKCRTAESRRRKDRRAEAARRAQHPGLHLVGDGRPNGQPLSTADIPLPMPGNDADEPAAPGVMEKAVQDDILETASTVAFHHSLETMALILAKEIDAPESKATKGASTKQLWEVLKSLRGQEGTDDGSIEGVFGSFQGPVLSGMPAPVRNTKKSAKPDPGT